MFHEDIVKNVFRFYFALAGALAFQPRRQLFHLQGWLNFDRDGGSTQTGMTRKTFRNVSKRTDVGNVFT